MGTDGKFAAWTSLVLLERFRGGDDAAAAEIFDRYFQRLTALARGRLSPRLARRTDPEDVVLSVYRSFFIDARGGRYTLGCQWTRTFTRLLNPNCYEPGLSPRGGFLRDHPCPSGFIRASRRPPPVR